MTPYVMLYLDYLSVFLHICVSMKCGLEIGYIFAIIKSVIWQIPIHQKKSNLASNPMKIRCSNTVFYVYLLYNYCKIVKLLYNQLDPFCNGKHSSKRS